MASEILYSIPFENISNKIIHKKAKLPEDREYWVLKYDANYTCNNDLSFGLYRSVIYDSTEKLLAFSPPKSMEYETFIKKYITNTTDGTTDTTNNNKNTNIFINEIIEGTMINLFFDVNANQWEISTKGAVGANYWFYRNQYLLDTTAKQPTFREMFLEALSTTDSDSESSPDFQYRFETLNKSWSYTFVLQHPANHIVLNIKKPKLYLVAVYEIRRESSEVRFISPLEYESESNKGMFQGLCIEFPKRYLESESNIKTLEKEYCSIHSPNTSVGLMFTNLETGERATLENPSYVQLCELRGNNPNLQYQYLSLKHMRKVDEFLKAFPQYKAIFWKFYTNYSDFVTNLHQSYVTYYIKKMEVKISKQYFPLVYKMHHEVYLPSLSTESKTIMKRKVVSDYVKNLTPGELIYYLNYPLNHKE